MAVDDLAPPHPPSAPVSTDARPGTDHKLRGRLGIVQLLFTVLAFNGPLSIVVGFAPVIIGYGNGLGAPVAYIVGASVIAVFAVGFIKMAEHVKNPGGFYSFVTKGLGREAGLGASFLALICYYACLLGCYAFGGIALHGLVADTFGGPNIVWWVWVLALLAVVSVLGYFNLDLSARLLTCLLALEAIVILVYDAVVVARGGAHGLGMASFLPHNIFSGSIGVALLFGMLCMGGFEVTVIFRDEVRDPERTIPRATYLFVVVVGAVFAGSTWATIQALGEDDAVAATANDPTGAFTSTVQTYLGAVGNDLVTVLLCTSIFAATLATHNVLSRYVFNLGVDGILPRSLGAVHKQHGSPHAGSVVTSAASVTGFVLLVGFGAAPALLYAQLIGIFGYALLMLLVMSSLAVMVFLVRTKPVNTTVWHRVIAPILALVSLITTIWLATTNIGLLITAGSTVVVGMFVVLYGAVIIGAIVAVVLKRRRPEVYERIGRQ